ncbi:hypothetical protein LguiA_017014 [Lonicera macranthoides]
MTKQKIRVTLNPTRKIRTKTKKPKFLSIRLQLSPETTQISGEMITTTHQPHQQLNLFPLHPEDRDTHDDNVEFLLSGSDGGATSLTGLLDDRSVSSSGEDNNETVSPSSVTGAYGVQDRELERTALRNRERDASEEVKWVRYSEVVKRKDEEVTSCAADLRYYHSQMRGLSLKLDYEEIMNAWSDKGPLYIHADSPQTVPDLQDDLLDHDNHNGTRQLGLWAVPEMSGGSNSSRSSSIKLIKDEEYLAVNGGEGGGEEWKKLGNREASVLRYKEKRRNRLFAKKIRYEVRKLNAEKRPRIKGRFVKRS